MACYIKLSAGPTLTAHSIQHNNRKYRFYQVIEGEATASKLIQSVIASLKLQQALWFHPRKCSAAAASNQHRMTMMQHISAWK